MGDKAIGVNQDGTWSTLNVSLSGLTIRWTRNDIAVNAAFTQTGGAMDIFLTGTGAVPGPTTTITNCIFDGNASAHSYGGALNIDSGDLASGTNIFRGTVSITGTTFSGNRTLETGVTSNQPCGGAINMFADKHNVTVSSSTLSGNSTLHTDGNGGAINVRHSYGGTVQLTSDSIQGNSANGYGGGVLVVFNQVTNIDGGSLQNNTTTHNASGNSAAGGGIYFNAATGWTTTLTNVAITGNHADAGTAGAGGGIYCSTGGQVNLSGCTISSNTADYGAGVGSWLGPLAISGGSITGNTASVSGGALSSLAANAAATLTNLTISGNSAVTSGGAFHVSAGTLTANLCRIVSNSAPTGQGIAQSGGTASVENDWWGCDGFPGAAGCQSGSGIYDADPRIDLRLTASPTAILLGGTSTITADITKNTNGVSTNGGNAPAVLVGLNFTFVDDPKGSLNAPLTVAIPIAGTATKTFTAGVTGSSCGAATPGVTVDSGTQTAAIQVQCPDVVVAKSGPSSICVGSTITWTLTPKNNGDATASTVTVTDDLPDCLTGVTCTPTVGTCSVGAGNVATASLGTLVAGASATITLSGTVAAACPAGLSNLASIATPSVESNTANNSSSTVSTTVNTSPSISGQPSNATICAGTGTTFSVSAAGSALTPQWQVDTGSGFTNLSNGGVYSNVTTLTMSITGATIAMNGYHYRCVVSGVCAPSVTSNGATLTVESPLPSVGNTARIQRSGSNLVLTWTNVAGATDYAVYEDASPSGTFTTLTGTAASGTTGLTVAIPAAERFYKAAARNSCGPGQMN